MAGYAGTCPLTQQQLLEEYFLEHRTKILDIAAFLDRMDRSVGHNAAADFRLVAFRKALRELCSDTPGKVGRAQMLLSDQTMELLAQRDRQSAYGASSRPEKDGSQ